MRSPENVLESLKSKACNKSYKYERLYRNPVSYTHQMCIRDSCFRVLADYLHLLRVWKTDYAPHSPEEAFHPRFVEALLKQAHVEYLLDVLQFGETEEKAVLIMVYGKDVIQLDQRMAELAAADAARTKKHHKRHAAAPEH